jgi:hypothetical protein
VKEKAARAPGQSALLDSCQMRREALALCVFAGRAGTQGRGQAPQPVSPQPQTWGVESGDLLAKPCARDGKPL